MSLQRISAAAGMHFFTNSGVNMLMALVLSPGTDSNCQPAAYKAAL